LVNIANNRKMEWRGCSYGELPGNINSSRHRQIGAATEKIAEGRKRGRACSCGNTYL
jgi:hypothetical protein